MHTIDKAVNVIHATGALKKFLDARATGGSEELLLRLSAEALAEQEAERGRRSDEPRLRFGDCSGPARGVVIKLDQARSLKKDEA